MCSGKAAVLHSWSDFENAPLGQLINTFKKLCDNPSLVADLRKFQAERNFLSHKSITHCLDPEGELDNVAVAQFEVRLSQVQPEAERLRLAIHEEANKFRGYLWFSE